MSTYEQLIIFFASNDFLLLLFLQMEKFGLLVMLNLNAFFLFKISNLVRNLFEVSGIINDH